MINRSGGIAILFAMTALLSACDPAPQKTKIITRTLSPDGRREAVYALDMGGGATVGAATTVYVTKPGSFPKLEDRIFIGDRVCDLKVQWSSKDEVTISYVARRPEDREQSQSSLVAVHLHWLGRDPANGC